MVPTQAGAVGDGDERPPLLFEGQTSYDLGDDLLYFRHVRVDDELGPRAYEPREKPGFSPPIRMDGADRPHEYESDARLTYRPPSGNSERRFL